MERAKPPEGTVGATGRPSEVSRARLADSVRREIGDLRVRVHEGLLRSELLIEVGRPDEAAVVLGEQRILVDEIRERMESVVVAAAVEREAELILAAAEAELIPLATPVRDAEPGSRRSRFVTAVTALAGAAAGLLLFTSASGPSAPTLSVDDQRDAVESRAPVASTPADAKPDDGLVASAQAALDSSAGSDADPAVAADRAAAAGDTGDPAVGDDPGQERDWLQRVLLHGLDDGPAREVRELLGLEDVQPLPEGGPPISETIDETSEELPVDDEDGSDEPGTPAPPTGD